MPVGTQNRTLLWYCPQPARADVIGSLPDNWSVCWCDRREKFLSQLDQAQVVMIAPPCDDRFDASEVNKLLEAVDLSSAVAVVLLPSAMGGVKLLENRHGQFIPLEARCSDETLLAAIESAFALQQVIGELRAEVAASRGLGGGVARKFQQFDEEMRLAARLQQDFLPRKLPVIGPVHFATLFRPVGWVSGDIYDVARLDETHVGFYVADAVGHGMPAALLTMFIKKAMQTKRITDHSYEIIPPDEVLAQLNRDLCEQNLSACQFCTACYAILDTRNLSLAYARGGHPHPIVLGADRSVGRLEAPGALLGVFPEERFPTRPWQLRRGDRLVMFSDGAEDTLITTGADLLGELQRLRSLPAEDLVLQLTMLIEERRAANACLDDITMIVMDVGA